DDHIMKVSEIEMVYHSVITTPPTIHFQAVTQEVVQSRLAAFKERESMNSVVAEADGTLVINDRSIVVGSCSVSAAVGDETQVDMVQMQDVGKKHTSRKAALMGNSNKRAASTSKTGASSITSITINVIKNTGFDDRFVDETLWDPLALVTSMMDANSDPCAPTEHSSSELITVSATPITLTIHHITVASLAEDMMVDIIQGGILLWSHLFEVSTMCASRGLMLVKRCAVCVRWAANDPMDI
ncbi:hypothetical protein FRB95_011040, partial [Tulasnella sp. JGI-2019a]